MCVSGDASLFIVPKNLVLPLAIVWQSCNLHSSVCRKCLSRAHKKVDKQGGVRGVRLSMNICDTYIHRCNVKEQIFIIENSRNHYLMNMEKYI